MPTKVTVNPIHNQAIPLNKLFCVLKREPPQMSFVEYASFSPGKRTIEKYTIQRRNMPNVRQANNYTTIRLEVFFRCDQMSFRINQMFKNICKNNGIKQPSRKLILPIKLVKISLYNLVEVFTSLQAHSFFIFDSDNFSATRHTFKAPTQGTIATAYVQNVNCGFWNHGRYIRARGRICIEFRVFHFFGGSLDSPTTV
jgi:hypothetical protein